jgi:nitroreductase
MEGANPSRTAGSSIYPAVEHMLLAARALGLGATLTTLYLTFEKEVEAVLGLPADVRSLHRSRLLRRLRLRALTGHSERWRPDD